MGKIKALFKPFKTKYAMVISYLSALQERQAPSPFIAVIDKKATLNDYSQMQKKHYENEEYSSAHIIGSYDWHEKFPYKTFCCMNSGA